MSAGLQIILIIAGVIVGLGLMGAVIRWLRLASRSDYFVGKVVIITGASRGIGALMAQEFAKRGANLVLAARNTEQLNTVAGVCRAANAVVETLIVQVDVTNDEQLQQLVDQTVARFGRIDILINNAGIRQGGTMAERDRNGGRVEIEVNLLATMRLTQLTLPVMLKQQAGHIVSISSAAGRLSEPHFVPYGVSKHGLIGFCDGLRRELAGTGLHVMMVLPDFAATDMVTEIGPVYKRMGLAIIPPERVVRRTLAGLVLGRVSVKVGILASVGGYIGVLMPWVIDLYYRLFMAKDFAEAARRQWSE